VTRRALGALMLLLAAAAWPAPARSDPMAEGIAHDLPALVALYRDLRAAPELAFGETATAQRLAAELRALGFSVETGVGRTGVVGVLHNGPGPVLMIRTDMDALPLPGGRGAVHACGHDLHMAVWVGTARRLVAMRGQWSGTLLFVAQPAEETGEGARAMIEDGLFERFPRPSHALALHASAMHPTGVVAFTPGPAMAMVDTLDVTIRGTAGHGAAPAQAHNPIVLAARTNLGWQALADRQRATPARAVLSVGAIAGGASHNAIGEEVELKLTLRTFSPEVRRELLDAIRAIAEREARAMGLPAERMPIVRVKADATPVLVNPAGFAYETASAIAMRIGRDRVVQLGPVMGGEDFARYREALPELKSLLFWLGAVNRDQFAAARGDGRLLPSLHSPAFAPDAEPAIATGVEAMLSAALSIVGPPQQIVKLFPRNRLMDQMLVHGSGDVQGQ
jgi:amidohydrolase